MLPFCVIPHHQWYDLMVEFKPDLSHLRSIELGDNAFGLSASFILHSLPSLQSIILGNSGFLRTPSFSLTGLDYQILLLADLPSLHLFIVGSSAFNNSQSFVMRNLTSLSSVKMGSRSFYSVSSFSMTSSCYCSLFTGRTPFPSSNRTQELRLC